MKHEASAELVTTATARPGESGAKFKRDTGGALRRKGGPIHCLADSRPVERQAAHRNALDFRRCAHVVLRRECKQRDQHRRTLHRREGHELVELVERRVLHVWVRAEQGARQLGMHGAAALGRLPQQAPNELVRQ